MNDRDKQMNNKKDEALKLALYVLNEVRNETFRLQRNGQTLYAEEKVWNAVFVIKQALAEQCVCGEPDTPGTHRTDGPCLAEQPAQQQEPVANYCKECLTYNGHHEGCSHYTTPPAPASKPWVGMTDEEFRAIGQRFENDNGHVQAWMSFARHIQFALKEKNT